MPWKVFTQLNLMFVGKARAYPSEAHLRFSTLGQAPGLTHKYKTRLERLDRDKRSSLLRTLVNYGRKKFYSIEPWFVRLQIIINLNKTKYNIQVACAGLGPVL